MNRKQRRAAASAKGRKLMKNKAKKEELTADEFMERLNKMLAGKIDPPNEMVGYFVDQMRKIGSEADVVRKNLQQHRETAARLENRARELQGMQQKCIQDVQHWDKPEEPVEEPANQAAENGQPELPLEQPSAQAAH
jgi:hypothetical protein